MAVKTRKPETKEFKLAQEGFTIHVVPGAEPGGEAVPYLWVGEGDLCIAYTGSSIRGIKKLHKALGEAIEFYESA